MYFEMPTRPIIQTICDPPSSAHRGSSARHAVPLLALAPPALALGEELLGEGDEETNVRDFWNVLSKASDIVKDGERLENLAWRQWCQHRRDSSSSISPPSAKIRRVSASSSGTTCSTASLATPHLEQPPSPTASTSSRHSDRRTFGSALKLVMEEDHFKDWISDAQRNLPLPVLSVPDTPVANFEIRLVEPTPVPSRVGSLGGSMGGAGLLGVAVPPRLTEEPEEQEVVEEEDEEESSESEEQVRETHHSGRGKSIGPSASRSPRKRGKFFVHSSPSKGSGSDTAASPNTTALAASKLPDGPVLQTPGSLTSLGLPPRQRVNHVRHNSGSSASGGEGGPIASPVAVPISPVKKRSPGGKRHVSLSTMRGRFGQEKRKAAERMAQKAEAEAEAAAAQGEDSGWEDEVEEDGEEDSEDGYEDEDEEEDTAVSRPEGTKGQEAGVGELGNKAQTAAVEPDEEVNSADGDWSDEASEAEQPEVPPAPSPVKRLPQPAAQPQRPKYDRRHSSNRSDRSNANNKSASNLDLTALLQRTTSRRKSDGPPPPPANTPLRNMSKKQRMAAMDQRRRMEAELEAQKKREMFAKQQIFGAKPVAAEGLLSGIFKKGGSMVDLTAAINTPPVSSPLLRPSPSHAYIPSLAKSPMGPGILRSKSAVAVPVQTGVSVTRVSPKRSKLSEEIGSGGSGESKIEMGRRSQTSDRSDKVGSNEHRPPEGIVLESDDSSSEDDDYLATSSTQRKLAELAARKAERKGRRSNEEEPIAGPSIPVPTGHPILQGGQAGVRFEMPGVIQPMTPTTRRRAIISREMSESLRRNLILEREKSSGGGPRRSSGGPPQHSRPPPITHVSALPARNSSANLAQYHPGPPLARHQSETALHQDANSPHPHRPHSPYGHHGHSPAPMHPQPHRSATTGSVITINTKQRPQHLAPDAAQPGENSAQAGPAQQQQHGHIVQPEPQRRKTQPSVLGGFLRPLTRVGVGDNAGTISRTQSSANLTRAQSSANLTTSSAEVSRSVSPSLMEAPAMVRRSTEGSPLSEWTTEVDRRRELARRHAGLDTSYRSHGW